MNELQQFEQKHMMLFIELQDLERQAKLIEARKAVARDIIAKAMEENSITGVDNDYVTITYVNPSESTSLDTKRLRAEDPKTFAKLMKDYSKTTKRKGYVRITVKDD